MLFSRRDLEGYVKIDHRDSPGFSEGERAGAGLPVAMPIGRGTVFEAPTFTCPHCQTVVIINPLRTRERAYCASCDRNVCDSCGAAMRAPGYVHKPFQQIIDDFLDRAAKGPS